MFLEIVELKRYMIKGIYKSMLVLDSPEDRTTFDVTDNIDL